jgi:hypothetical protein
MKKKRIFKFNLIYLLHDIILLFYCLFVFKNNYKLINGSKFYKNKGDVYIKPDFLTNQNVTFPFCLKYIVCSYNRGVSITFFII